MTLKNQILNILKDKDKMHLKDMYDGLAPAKPSAIRSVINASIIRGETIFVRMGKGFYRLPTQDPVQEQGIEKEQETAQEPIEEE